MNSLVVKRSRWMGALAIVAVVFGVATIISGGRTLFDAETQQRAGNYVAFVLWFNFAAGFAYVIAGVGLWFRKRWAVWLAFAIAAATLVTFAAFSLHVWRGGSYEMRTVGAMVLRAMTWITIAAVAYAKLANTHAQVAI
jgi:hypothetical protein